MDAPRRQVPNRRPLACGALGHFDRERVLRAARELDPGLEIVHESAGAILLLDRPPVQWSRDGAAGFAWSERVDGFDGAGFASWRDVATTGAGAGLVVEAGRTLLHSSVSGVTPVYHFDGGDATYFCSRIDPLIAASPDRCTCDWESWASLLSVGQVLGSGTPFAEVRRLTPFSTLELRDSRPVVSAEPWPWSQIEPTAPLSRAAGETLAALRSAIATIPEGAVICPLSGGWDSRLILRLLTADRPTDLTAVTAAHHDGSHPEEAIAARVARMLDVPQTILASTEVAWWPAVRWGAREVDFQQPLFRWHLQLIAGLRGSEGTVADGFGLDTLGRSRWVSEATAGGSRDAMRGVWAAITRVPKRVTTPAYTHRFRRALLATARRRFMLESERFADHPSRGFLTDYWARQIRGTACRPALRLGSEHPVATPCADHDVISAALSAPARERAADALYREIFTQLDPSLWDLGSTNEDPDDRAERATSRPTAADARDYAELLAATPLVPHLGRRVQRFVASPRERIESAPAAAYPPYLFALWYERYRDRIREPDPAELL